MAIFRESVAGETDRLYLRIHLGRTVMSSTVKPLDVYERTVLIG